MNFRHIFRMVICLLAILVIAVVLGSRFLAISLNIPSHLLVKNTERSVDILLDEGLYPELIDG